MNPLQTTAGYSAPYASSFPMNQYSPAPSYGGSAQQYGWSMPQSQPNQNYYQYATPQYSIPQQEPQYQQYPQQYQQSYQQPYPQSYQQQPSGPWTMTSMSNGIRGSYNKDVYFNFRPTIVMGNTFKFNGGGTTPPPTPTPTPTPPAPTPPPGPPTGPPTDRPPTTTPTPTNPTPTNPTPTTPTPPASPTEPPTTRPTSTASNNPFWFVDSLFI